MLPIRSSKSHVTTVQPLCLFEYCGTGAQLLDHAKIMYLQLQFLARRFFFSVFGITAGEKKC